MSCMKPNPASDDFAAPLKSARPVEYHIRVPPSGIHRAGLSLGSEIQGSPATAG
jgi:hypothetical protein